MRPNQSSLTAENNAILRANEFLRPPEERICHDPYALYFLPESIFSADDRNDQIQAAVSRWETHFPGVCNAILARTRFIDDCLEQAISEGIRQLVILGAGYDTRALRFDALRQGMMVFEADHPATQRLKTERIDKYLDVDLANVHFLPVDLSGEGRRKRCAKA
ncbi:MAG: SAM-dependent methyltransferase [Desulfosarcinaceae bacterium]